MTSLKPYLLRAVYDWAMENGCTPYVAVDATYAGVQVPERFVEGGRIVLNIAPSAIHGYQLDDDGLSFSARFGGAPSQVIVPLPAILAIYAKENGQGISFPEPGKNAESEPTPPDSPTPKKGPTLKIVK
ncbi:MAG: ClpXP protease specificity-enhancing factor [Pseudomonadota bacterium]|nr:MAG: ClpXP protease specificity-enhancing factor [Pseudomonadota bacterium]